jgi:hypothetical protein
MTEFEEIFTTNGIEEMSIKEIETVFNQFRSLLKNDSYSEKVWERIYTEIPLGESEESMGIGELKTPFVNFCQRIYQRIVSSAEQVSSQEEIATIQPLLGKFLSGYRRSGEGLSRIVKEEHFLPAVKTAGGKSIQKRNAFGEFCFLYIYQKDGEQQKLERVWYELLKNQINDKKNALINDKNLTRISVLGAVKSWKMKVEKLIDENIKNPELKNEAQSFLIRAGTEIIEKKNKEVSEQEKADIICLRLLAAQIFQKEEECRNNPNIGEQELRRLNEGSFWDTYFEYENTNYLPQDFIEKKIRSWHIEIEAKNLINDAEKRIRKIICEKLGVEVESEEGEVVETSAQKTLETEGIGEISENVSDDRKIAETGRPDPEQKIQVERGDATLHTADLPETEVTTDTELPTLPTTTTDTETGGEGSKMVKLYTTNIAINEDELNPEQIEEENLKDLEKIINTLKEHGVNDENLIKDNRNWKDYWQLGRQSHHDSEYIPIENWILIYIVNENLRTRARNFLAEAKRETLRELKKNWLKGEIERISTVLIGKANDFPDRQRYIEGVGNYESFWLTKLNNQQVTISHFIDTEIENEDDKTELRNFFANAKGKTVAEIMNNLLQPEASATEEEERDTDHPSSEGWSWGKRVVWGVIALVVVGAIVAGVWKWLQNYRRPKNSIKKIQKI